MTQAIAKTYTFADENRALLAKTLLAGSVIMAMIYAYNMYMVVTKTVLSQSIEKQVAAVENEADKLDGTYISLSSKITPQMVSDYGLEQTTVSEYISRTRAVGSNAVSIQL